MLVQNDLLGNVAEIISGQSPEGTYYNQSGEGLPLYQGKKDFGPMFTTASGVYTTQITKVADPGDILISVRAPVGPVNFAGERMNIGRGLAAIKPGDSLDPKFLFMYLRYSEAEIAKLGGGTTFSSINRTHLKNLEIPLPLVEEQKRIVKKLDKVFKAIDKAKENTEKNLMNVEELFESTIESTFTRAESSWGKERISNVFDFNPPKSEVRDRLNGEDEVTFLPMSDLKSNQKEFIPITKRKLDGVIKAYTYFAEEDVLLAKITPCFENGKLGIARNIINETGFGSSEYIVMRSKGQVLPDLLYYFLRRKSFREHGKKIMTGASGHLRLPVSFVEESMIAFPKETIAQAALIKKLDTIATQTQKLQNLYRQKLKDLDELRQSYLKQAFEGKL